MADTELNLAKNRIQTKIDELRANMYPVSTFREHHEKKAIIQGMELALQILDDTE